MRPARRIADLGAAAIDVTSIPRSSNRFGLSWRCGLRRVDDNGIVEDGGRQAEVEGQRRRGEVEKGRWRWCGLVAAPGKLGMRSHARHVRSCAGEGNDDEPTNIVASLVGQWLGLGEK